MASQDAKDYGIIGIWVLLIVAGAAVLIFAPAQDGASLTSHDVEQIVQRNQPPTFAASVASSPVPPRATGESVITNVLSLPFVTSEYADDLDYHTPREYDRSQKLDTLRRLKLGEIALLRRLMVAAEHTQNRRRCLTVFGASGIQQPDLSLTRLEDTNLVVITNNDEVTITDLGRELTWVFTQWLAHSPNLVAAYRQVTPAINATIRFDGRPLAH